MAIAQTRFFEFDYPTSPLLYLIRKPISHVLGFCPRPHPPENSRTVIIRVWTGLSLWIGLDWTFIRPGLLWSMFTFQILRPITCVAWTWANSNSTISYPPTWSYILDKNLCPRISAMS